MSVPEDNVTVRYSVKELFAQINGKMDALGERVDKKIDVLADKLDAKADHEALIALEARVQDLEDAAVERRGFDKAKAAVIALSVAVVGLAVPIVLHFV